VKKVENGTAKLLCSTVLGGAGGGGDQKERGGGAEKFIWAGNVFAVQQNTQVSWMHQDPVEK